jgi:hypothetical protein
MRALLLLPALAACAAEPEPGDSAADAVDKRFDIPDVADGDLQWVLPEQVIAAGEDVMNCYVDTWDGADLGVNRVETWQAEGYGHHLLIWTGEVDPDLYPDGSTFDCSDAQAMSGWLPLFIVHPDRVESGAEVAVADLPDGMGLALEGGSRMIIQSHYLNASVDAIRVQDAVNLEVMPEDEVETWAAAWGHGITNLDLPPGARTTETLACGWPESVNLLYLFGHMHEHGAALTLDHTTTAGTTRLYEVPGWTPEYRDTPPVTTFEMPGYPVAAGDVFTTACSFDNDGDETLGYPEEMCATAGIAYPSRLPLFCNQDQAVAAD